MVKRYAPVNFDGCRFPEAAKAMARGLEGIQQTHRWDLSKTMEQLAARSGITLNSLRQIRAGDRDPRRSAHAVSAAIQGLGGPKIVFPSQRQSASADETTEAGPNTAGTEQGFEGPLTIADAKRRLAATLGVPEAAVEIIIRA